MFLARTVRYALAFGLLLPLARDISAQVVQRDATLMPVILDRADGTHETRWTAIDAAGRSYDLDTLRLTGPSLRTLRAGTSLRLSLTRAGAAEAVTRLELREPPVSPRGLPQRPGGAAFAAGASAWADAAFSGPLPVLVIPCAFSDAGPTSATRQAMERAMNDEFPGVGAFIRSASGGRASLAGTRVLDWVTLPSRVAEWFPNRTTAHDPLRHSSMLARDEALIAACLAEGRRREPSLAVQPYTAIQMMLPVDIGVSYAYLGPVPLNSVDATRRLRVVMNSNWAATSAGVQAHELGHTLGLLHTSGPYGMVYDSQWDVMSNPHHGLHAPTQLRFGTLFNGWHRMRLGWDGDDGVINVPLTTLSDTIRLVAPTGGPGVRTARVALAPIGPGPERVLTLEARRRDAQFESAVPLEGIVMHRVSDFAAIVVDRDGNNNVNDAGAVLRPGEQWDDDTEGLSVAVLSSEANGYQVAITRRTGLRLVATTFRWMQRGRPYQDSLGVVGGVAPVRLAADGLPPGVRLDTARRMLVGVPTVDGVFAIRVRAIDAAGDTTSRVIDAFVDPLDPIAMPLVREGRVGEARVDTLALFRTGTGFNARSCLGTMSGVPQGMRLEIAQAGPGTQAFLMRGTPTATVDAVFEFALCADDERDRRRWALTFRIRPPRLVVLGDSLRAPRIEGLTGADTMRLGGGAGGVIPGLRWRVTAGALPVGWQLDPLTGVASGVARTPGSFAATVQALAPNDTATATLRWTIVPALELAAAPWGSSIAFGLPREDTLRVLSRAGPPLWRVRAGALPAGITLSPQGVLRGAPSVVGPFQAELEVRAGEATRTLALAGLVERLALQASWATADTLVLQGDLLLDSIRVRDGDGTPILVALDRDSMPPGLNFEVERRLFFGRPQVVGTWRIPFTVTQGQTRLTLTRTVRVTPMARLAEDTLPTATAGYPFAHTLLPLVTGGGTLTFRPQAALPAGLQVAPDGRVTGVPDALGAFERSVVLEVTRGDGQYLVPLTVRWSVREVPLDAAALFDAVLGVRALGAEPTRGLDLLGNRNDRLDIGDALQWLVRRGVLAPAASVQEVLPALERLRHAVSAATSGGAP